MVLLPLLSCFLLLGSAGFATASSPIPSSGTGSSQKHNKVLILGGGVAGVIAARTLHERGIDDFMIVEARHELGGRMQAVKFANKTVEQGANWIQGIQSANGTTNPIYTLAKKYKLKTQFNDWFGSVSTYDASGSVDFLNVLDESGDDYEHLTAFAGSRVDKSLVDVSARTGYSIVKAKSQDPHARASEYFQFDWEYAQTPEQSSAIASSWGNNFTYNPDQGGFSDDNQMSVDPRGFKTIIQQEADEFLKPNQKILDSTVKTISYSKTGVSVTLTNGNTLTGDYAICTFSLGVLQHGDVEFKPSLPDYKQEAIYTMVMATYTKIFLQFPKKFWFDTEMAIYADSERGRFPVWQSLDHPNFFPGSGIVFVTVTGDFSVRIEALSNKQVKEENLSTFISHDGTQTLCRGSYSNWPPSFGSQHSDNLRANVDRVFFAGEATSRKYFGYLHGAYFEGLAIGTTIANCLQGGPCADMERFAQVTNALPYENN